MYNTLLLNADYTPLKILSWQRAVCLWVSDKVEIVEEYEDFDLKSVSFTIKCPAVVRLLTYVNRRPNKVKFSRVNVFSRDQFTCQYCGDQPGTSRLTYDHVVPRAQGGRTTWENIVTSCLPCNAKKGNRTPQEAKMPLQRKPTRPATRAPGQFTLTLPTTPDSWRDYLYWQIELENDNGD